METSLQLMSHWQSAQYLRPSQHPSEAPGCLYIFQDSPFTNSHWGLYLFLSEPPAHMQTRVGLTLYINQLSALSSTSHPGQVQLLSFLPLAKGLRVFPRPQCCVITRWQGKKSWACGSARRQLPAWIISSGGCVLHQSYVLSR